MEIQTIFHANMGTSIALQHLIYKYTTSGVWLPSSMQAGTHNSKVNLALYQNGIATAFAPLHKNVKLFIIFLSFVNSIYVAFCSFLPCFCCSHRAAGWPGSGSQWLGPRSPSPPHSGLQSAMFGRCLTRWWNQSYPHLTQKNMSIETRNTSSGTIFAPVES